MSLSMFAGALIAIAGATVLTMSVLSGRREAIDPGQYFRNLADEDEIDDPFQARLSQPFVARTLGPLRDAVVRGLGRLLPSRYLESVRGKLQLAGMSGTGRAETLVTGQVGVTLALAAMGVLFVLVAHPAARYAVLTALGLPLIGALLPHARINRAIAARQQAMRNDLPDTLDLLAISVEAGMGFEGALAVVCQHFDSPLAHEFSLTLREMELGLPRAEAFRNLKRRTDVAELNTFILALLQADALGIPVGRVLKTQSADMRMQRRMWAREKAAKLPVKMLFPLMLFIFPPIFVIVIGPAMTGIVKGMK